MVTHQAKNHFLFSIFHEKEPEPTKLAKLLSDILLHFYFFLNDATHTSCTQEREIKIWNRQETFLKYVLKYFLMRKGGLSCVRGLSVCFFFFPVVPLWHSNIYLSFLKMAHYYFFLMYQSIRHNLIHVIHNIHTYVSHYDVWIHKHLYRLRRLKEE